MWAQQREDFEKKGGAYTYDARKVSEDAYKSVLQKLASGF